MLVGCKGSLPKCCECTRYVCAGVGGGGGGGAANGPCARDGEWGSNRSGQCLQTKPFASLDSQYSLHLANVNLIGEQCSPPPPPSLSLVL